MKIEITFGPEGRFEAAINHRRPSPGAGEYPERRREAGFSRWESARPASVRRSAIPASRRRACVRDQRAFTLLELLLAIVIFAVVLSALHVVFGSALRLHSRTAESLERALPLQQTLGIIKRDLANIVPPGGALSGALQSTPTVSLTGGAVGLGGGLNRAGGPQFYTAVGSVDERSPWADVARVAYFLTAPTNDTPGQDLYRSIARNLLPLIQEESEDQFLMSGVESIAFQYFDGSAWKDTWDSTVADMATGLTNQLPAAIKLQLQLYEENRARGVPAPVELVVALPARARTNVTEVIQ